MPASRLGAQAAAAAATVAATAATAAASTVVRTLLHAPRARACMRVLFRTSSRPSAAAGWPADRSVTRLCSVKPMPRPGAPLSRTTNVATPGVGSTQRCTTNSWTLRDLSSASPTDMMPPRTSLPSAQHSLSPAFHSVDAEGCTSEITFFSVRPMPSGSASSMTKVLNTSSTGALGLATKPLA